MGDALSRLIAKNMRKKGGLGVPKELSDESAGHMISNGYAEWKQTFTKKRTLILTPKGKELLK